MPISARIVFKNMEVATPGGIISNHVVIVSNGIIEKVIPNCEYTGSMNFSTATVVDLQGALLCPGLIDLQIYGSGGILFGGQPSVEGLQQLVRDLYSQGTTGFLATIATNSWEVMKMGFESAMQFCGSESVTRGSFLGLHLEGPFINTRRRGAHPAEHIRQATRENVAELMELARGTVKVMTIAAELVEPDVREMLAAGGIVLSCGHSDASFVEAMAFLTPARASAAACLQEYVPSSHASSSAMDSWTGSTVPAVTHLFNAMPPLHHRVPGLVGAVFDKQPFASIVADGLHVDFTMVRLAKRLLGDKLFLITDAVTESNDRIYPHRLLQEACPRTANITRKYVMPDGTLSGSALTLPRAIQNCVEHCEISLAEAVSMASLYPARLLGLDGQKGEITAGRDADFCILDRRTYSVLSTYVAGVCVYSSSR